LYLIGYGNLKAKKLSKELKKVISAPMVVIEHDYKLIQQS